ncbi:MAG: diguanylate cyclase [Sulfurimonas sp.]
MIFAFSLLSILILNFYSYLLTKEKVYFYYVLYILTFIIFSAMHSGFYLLLGFHGWNEGLHVVGALVVVTLILFSDIFLQLKDHLYLVHKFFQFSAVVFFILAVLIFNNVPYSSHALNFFSLIFFSALFYAAVVTYLKGYVGAKYYLIALVIYTAMMALMVLTFNAFFEYTPINRHLFIPGAFIEIIFFTLILANKYKTITLEKINIQEELIQEKNRSEQELTQAVKSRTHELENAKKDLESLVRTDHLTCANNRRAYQEKVEDLLALRKRYEIPFCMIVFDIDNFKVINDTYGHHLGDQVLIDLVELINKNIRKNDHLYRIGGEEFVVLLENTSLEKAKTLTLSLLELIETQLTTIKEQTVTVSMGLTEANKNDSEDSLYKRADALLYRSKQNGKNRASF